MQGKFPLLKGSWKDGEFRGRTLQSPAQTYLMSPHQLAPLSFLPLVFGPGTGTPLVGTVSGFFLMLSQENLQLMNGPDLYFIGLRGVFCYYLLWKLPLHLTLCASVQEPPVLCCTLQRGTWFLPTNCRKHDCFFHRSEISE